MIGYLLRLKEKLDRQVGPGLLTRVVAHQGVSGLLNLARVSAQVARRRHPPSVGYSPPCLFLEVTNRCNLTCNTCPLGTPSLAYNGYQKADMSFEQARHVLDQFPNLVYVVVQGIGEPLLNKDTARIIRYCTERGISTYFNSNGTALTENKSREMIEAGLTNLSVSVNSFDEEIFAYTRAGASIKKIAENVARFVELRRAAGARRPLLSFRAILMKETAPAMEDLVARSEQIGVDVLYVQLLNNTLGDAVVGESCLSRPEVEAFLDKLRGWRVGRRIEIITEAFGESSNDLGQCQLPWFSPLVTAEGYVTPCCTIYNPSVLNMGNIFETPFSEIWNSEAFRRFRADFYDKQPPECVGCPNYK